MNEKQSPPIIIPGFIAKKPISHTAMILYGLIFSLQREEGYAWASNAHYADELNLSVASVKRYLKELAEANLILIKIDRYATDFVQRRIFLATSIAAFRAYEEEGRQLKYEPCIQDSSNSSNTKNTSSNSRLSREELKNLIEPIYKQYPRKLGKNLGLDRLFQKHFTFGDISDFGTAVANYSDFCKNEKIEEKYILHFSTFVGRWKDWLEIEVKSQSANQVVVNTVDELQTLFAPKQWKDTQ